MFSRQLVPPIEVCHRTSPAQNSSTTVEIKSPCDPMKAFNLLVLLLRDDLFRFHFTVGITKRNPLVADVLLSRLTIKKSTNT